MLMCFSILKSLDASVKLLRRFNKIYTYRSRLVSIASTHVILPPMFHNSISGIGCLQAYKYPPVDRNLEPQTLQYH
jgi:hypothetical protein